MHAGRDGRRAAPHYYSSEPLPTTHGGGNLLAARFMTLVEFTSTNEQLNETEPEEREEKIYTKTHTKRTRREKGRKIHDVKTGKIR